MVPADRLLEEAAEIAVTVALDKQTRGRAAREAVNRADDTSLREGVLLERRLFHALFVGRDPSEGMGAFLKKLLRPSI
ncbi:hypothetical protein [Streptomyces flavidovirens]|uniref:Enoyl-CoA hydratase n=1 Tax=Streptomyces flavidovirens TaxID=67298 RepID=A0ABW6RIE9_9ACTN